MIKKSKMTVRQRLNDIARKYGNKLVKFKENYGLGDFLTTRTTFRDMGKRVGRICGLLTYPLMTNFFTFPFGYAGGTILSMSASIAIGTLISIPLIQSDEVINRYNLNDICLGAFMGDVGYGVGELLDSLIGEPSPRTIEWRKLKKEIKVEKAYFGDITNFMTKEQIEGVFLNMAQ